jgi:hypothetical protein
MSDAASPTQGARALVAYLRAKGLSISAFCEQNGLDRIQVQRAIKGARHRYSVDFALSVERATGGRVRVAQWSSETARAESDRRARTGTDS